MNCDLFIRCPRKHHVWLRECFRSIAKFASGFRHLHLIVPAGEGNEVGKIWLDAWSEFSYRADEQPELIAHELREWPGKEFLFSMLQVLNSDVICIDADYIVHLDSDCIFTEPVTPLDFIIDGRPIMIRALYSELPNDQQQWQSRVQDATGLEAPWESMTRHPEVYIPETYVNARRMIRQHTGLEPVDYYFKGRNSFPQDRVEFPLLGAVALAHHPERYHIIDFKTPIEPPKKLIQFWSHHPSGLQGLFDVKDQIPRYGGMRTAESIIKEVLGSV